MLCFRSEARKGNTMKKPEITVEMCLLASIFGHDLDVWLRKATAKYEAYLAAPPEEQAKIDAELEAKAAELAENRVLASMTQKEERVLRMRFSIGMNTDHTLEEVGQPFSITRECFRQIETSDD